MSTFSLTLQGALGLLHNSILCGLKDGETILSFIDFYVTAGVPINEEGDTGWGNVAR
jgi:hypothetical protein